MSAPNNPNKYTGTRYAYAPVATGRMRDPTSNDVLNPIGPGNYVNATIWPNLSNGNVWCLAGITANAAKWTFLGGASAVAGPSSSTNTALARFNGTGGNLLENSVGLLSNGGVLTGITSMGIGIAPTALLTLAAGTATAGTAPLKFTAGVNLTSAVSGTVEYDGTLLTYTDSTPTRNALAVGPGASTSGGLASWSSTTGYKLLSNTPTISAGVITFPAGGGNILSAGTRKGTSVFSTGGVSAPITTSAVLATSIIVITRTNLAGSIAALGEYVTITPNTSFTVTSGDSADTSAFNWSIVG